MIVNLQDAGFETGFTSIYWAYASGFPKAMNIGKAVDKRLGAEREVVGKKVGLRYEYDFCDNSGKVVNTRDADKSIRRSDISDLTAPATPEAAALDGSCAGFQPKPAVEVVIVAMKPLAHGTYIDQALDNRKGVTWLDDGRIPHIQGEVDFSAVQRQQVDLSERGWVGHVAQPGTEIQMHKESGRFPANLIVENDILDTGGKKCISEDITPIAELDSKRDGVGTKECPRPTEMSFDTDNQKAKKQSEKYPKLSREGCCPRPTNGHSQNPESGSTMSGAESQIEAIQEARHTEDGDKPFLNGMGIDVNNATQQGMMEMGDCKFTISNPMPTSQNLSLTSTTDLRSASLATKRQKTSASGENTNFSRFFSLDSWWAEKLKELPESVQRTFPCLVVPKASK